MEVGIRPWFNIKKSFSKYKKSQCGDKTVENRLISKIIFYDKDNVLSVSEFSFNDNSYTDKTSSLYWISPFWVLEKYEYDILPLCEFLS